MRFVRPMFVAVLLSLLALPALAGNESIKEYVLFGGSNVSASADTSEMASPWFNVKGASRVEIRFWSANTSAWTAADSTFSDSLATFKVLLSDSICCNVVGPSGIAASSAADSIIYDFAVTNPDTAKGVGIGAKPLPINRPLAPAKSGSGFVTVIYPVISTALAANAPDFGGIIAKDYMRIRTEAVRRMTEGGRLSTAGIRTVGIRKLRGRALVYFKNK